MSKPVSPIEQLFELLIASDCAQISGRLCYMGWRDRPDAQAEVNTLAHGLGPHIVGLHTHRAMWRNMLIVAIAAARGSTQSDRLGYLQQELDAFDRIFEALVGPMPGDDVLPTSTREFVANWNTDLNEGTSGGLKTPSVPKINIRCETEAGPIMGTTYLEVIRVEAESDGSFTAVTNHWPVDGRTVTLSGRIIGSLSDTEHHRRRGTQIPKEDDLLMAMDFSEAEAQVMAHLYDPVKPGPEETEAIRELTLECRPTGAGHFATITKRHGRLILGVLERMMVKKP